MIRRREGVRYVAPGWRWPGVVAAIEYMHKRRVAAINQEGRLVYVLIGLVALAPWLILIGRMLTK